MKIVICFYLSLLLTISASAGHINRKALVSRHNIRTSDVSQILALGNGEFCFSVDGTGLQTFGGNSMANWAWHSFPLPQGATMADVPETGTIETGKLVGLMKHASAKPEVSNWMFQNPHRFNIGHLQFVDRNGKVLDSTMMTNSCRTLDLWRGIQIAEFSLNGKQVKVTTLVHPGQDMIVTRIESDLLSTADLAVELGFPYPEVQRRRGETGRNEHDSVEFINQKNSTDFIRTLDQMSYHISWQWSDHKALFCKNRGSHSFRMTPSAGTRILEFSCAFGSQKIGKSAGMQQSMKSSEAFWTKYWRSGGAIDLSESKDPRWKELERRIVLSQYLMRTQSAGSWPPSELSLMGVDDWSAQFHMEMVWWHLAHYGLWDRWEMASKALDCYKTFLPTARKLATQFGYTGAKWGKQVGPEGRTAPWDPTYLLHWQQPHPIFLAEMEYRLNSDKATLKKWAEIVSETAEYMADFPVLKEDNKYHLTPICTANENGIGDDPAFENSYWRWALAKAQEWRERAGLPRNPKWEKVLENLAPLPQSEGVYLFCHGWINSYSKYNQGHPDPLGVCAFLPLTEGVDRETAKRTVEKIYKEWNWADTWGWDFPWSAMAAARVGRPDLAVEILLKDVKKNSYTLNGINDGWYFPGNGGLLYAAAMMAAGWDGAPLKNAPGFPDNGQWTVRWEGLKKAL